MARNNRKLEREKRMRRLAEAQRHLKRGTCPQCGCGLRRNGSMTGWYQCNALGAAGFQTGDGVGKAPCSFQFFFDPTPEELEKLSSFEFGIGTPQSDYDRNPWPAPQAGHFSLLG